MNSDLGRRLIDLERSLGAHDGGAAPRMVTLLAFAGEDDQAAAFASELREHFREASTYVEVLDLTGPRPEGLKPAWAAPRLWLDYTPSPAELADLRPDLRPPTAPRADWNPTMPSETPENAPAAAQDASSSSPQPPASPGGKNGLLGTVAPDLSEAALALARSMAPPDAPTPSEQPSPEDPDALH